MSKTINTKDGSRFTIYPIAEDIDGIAMQAWDGCDHTVHTLTDDEAVSVAKAILEEAGQPQPSDADIERAYGLGAKTFGVV
jgi:hypothetical protein